MSTADWSTTAASNTSIGGINIAENCPPGNINDAIREMMAQLRTSVSTNALNSGSAALTGDLVITYSGNPALRLNSTGATIAELTAQSDGSVVLRRFNGATNDVIWYVQSNTGPFHFGVPITTQGATVWNAGNDGSGSTLDADTVDGKHASEFVGVVASSIVSNGGYRAYSDGLIETWGSISIGPDSTGTYVLPYAHTSWVVPVISAYWPSDQTVSQHAVDWSATNGSPPSSISFRNSDDRTVTVWIQTKGA